MPRIPRQNVSESAPSNQFLTGPQVWQRYSISDVCLWRWMKDSKIGFPQPAMVVSNRRYWLERDLIDWERSKLPGGEVAEAR
jgi:predicted DNA-binding transcriptional regulator AlpA